MIPPTLPVTARDVPRLQSGSPGHYDTRCGRCCVSSPAVRSESEEAAWAILVELGWTIYRVGPGYGYW